MRTDEFFSFARERHAIYLRRAAGLPAPWTTDPILQQFKFTNVFRELDRTTAWFRTHVREPLRGSPEVLLATVIFRWFNSIRTGETLFLQPDMLRGGRTPFRDLLLYGDTKVLRDALRKQGSPWLSAAYMIRSPDGLDKVDGLVSNIQHFLTTKFEYPGEEDHGHLNWREVAELCIADGMLPRPVCTIERMVRWLSEHDGLGPFLGYEVATDLRHTAVLERAPDIHTWANPGPGAQRGVARLLGVAEQRARKGSGKLRMTKVRGQLALETMRQLLEESRKPENWPQEVMDPSGWYEFDGSGLDDWMLQGEGDWPQWEMRDVEHTLCEWDKWERARLGQGRPKHLFEAGARK